MGRELWLTGQGLRTPQEPAIVTVENFEESYDLPEECRGIPLETLYFISKQLLENYS